MKVIVILILMLLGTGLYVWIGLIPATNDAAVTTVDSEAMIESDFFLDDDEHGDLPIVGVAPELVGLENWVNSEPIHSLASLRGKVVLVDFWTLGCINCQRTFPHIQTLYDKYKNDGFVILGIHAPEFAYERKIENVRAAAVENGMTYPIAQDNDFATWRNYKNQYWPAQYLIDKQGNVRYTHFGEGQYLQMDKNVAVLLKE